MKVLPIILAPDPILKKVSKPVETIDDTLRQFMNNMVTTMYSASGVGLAAVQVGMLKRILVIDVDYEVDDHDHHHHDHHGCSGVHVSNTNPRFFINPEIVEISKESHSYNEGCLSFPDMRSEVIRPEIVKVKYLDENGKECVEEMDGLLATCIQHEIDHLNGITFVDHISKLKRDVILNKMKKLQKK
jgi:peptide deformylase